MMKNFDLMNRFAQVPPNSTQHFYPEDHFMEWWAKYVDGRFVIEVGAGMCHFTRAMHKVGIKALAIEPRATEEVRTQCFSFLYPMCIQQVGILKFESALVVAARPDHSGWFRELPDLIHPESKLFYIGLPWNFEIDSGGLEFETLHTNAGRDGEHVLEIKL